MNERPMDSQMVVIDNVESNMLNNFSFTPVYVLPRYKILTISGYVRFRF